MKSCSTPRRISSGRCASCCRITRAIARRGLFAGLFLYDHLGGRKNCGTRTLDLLRDPEGAPILDSFHKGFEYSDCWVDDARPVTLNAVDAAERGATILTRTRCVAAERKAGARKLPCKIRRPANSTGYGQSAGECLRPVGAGHHQ